MSGETEGGGKIPLAPAVLKTLLFKAGSRACLHGSVRPLCERKCTVLICKDTNLVCRKLLALWDCFVSGLWLQALAVLSSAFCMLTTVLGEENEELIGSFSG